jgi:hypothetical protein
MKHLDPGRIQNMDLGRKLSQHFRLWNHMANVWKLTDVKIYNWYNSQNNILILHILLVLIFYCRYKSIAEKPNQK